jgi:hypothetical protein
VRYGNLPFSAAFNIWHAAPRFCYHCVTTESAVSGSDRNGPIKALRDSTPDASPTMLSGGSWPLSRPLSHSTDLARRSARTHRGPVDGHRSRGTRPVVRFRNSHVLPSTLAGHAGVGCRNQYSGDRRGHGTRARPLCVRADPFLTWAGPSARQPSPRWLRT